MYFTLHHMNDVMIVKQGCSPKMLTRGVSRIVRAPCVAGNLGNLGGRMLLSSCLRKER